MVAKFSDKYYIGHMKYYFGNFCFESMIELGIHIVAETEKVLCLTGKYIDKVGDFLDLYIEAEAIKIYYLFNRSKS